MTTRTCGLADCHGKHYAKGWCYKHYLRERRTGSATTVRVGHRFTEQDPVTRLWERSEWQGDCLVYTAGTPTKSGHRQIGVNGRYQGVHRVAYAAVHGPIPPGVVVRHSCDNPPCIWEDHLLPGTVADNNRDRDQRGRHVPLRGEANGFHRLRDDEVRTIRTRLADGESTRTVAADYGVSQGTVWLISAGKTWRHVTT